ncbi:putative disease resistance RPP13-like protein 1 [Eucalyptus grandis]|uniref:putative disease resistance RPP13-like protein 1 n=1 Tax=Eucalyptus grandis TaxID=71139 RepID=UPI00192EAA6A|nr:putative disease resistance RPP13-like protein 1 [Eucalyptus grandis]
MPITELFLGAFLQVLFDRLASRELLNFARREGIDKLLKKWEKLLTSIDQVLVDAENRQLTSDRAVKSWLEDLRDLAYDIEDLLDEFATESAKNKSKVEPSTSKACSLLPSSCFRLSPRMFMLDHKMRSKIEKMDNKLQEIITQKDNLSLTENNGQRSAYCRLDNPLPTTHLSEPIFVSREDEKMAILKLLTREEDNRTCVDLKVIVIVGMGGIGKTALAQQVYNDVRVTNYFEVNAWVCVSGDFNALTITKRILEATNFPLSCDGKDLNWLQEKLNENLFGKKFLVVLDGVWSQEYGSWTILLKPLQSGAKGSKIIITTRIFAVASLTNGTCHHLRPLSLDACMTVFAFHALGVANFDDHPDLKVLGRKIVEKCKGLPLAVKTLAGILRTSVNRRTWEGILNSKFWDLPEEKNEILPALKLSYLHLPSHLRRCFAYCAIFPFDYEIQRDELVHFWIAEGLVEGKEGRNCWNVGLTYFNELVSRSLLQKSSSDESRFLMHDLVNNLAKLAAGVTHFCSGEFMEDNNNASLARHASLIPGDHILPQTLNIYRQMQGLRSFISLKKQFGQYEGSFVSQEVLFDLLSRLKYLRVLSLSHYYISEVPDCIGELRHLRQLNLSYTNIERLPKSIVALYNLEALMLQSCHHLIELPKGMEKLINLKFLDITDTWSLRVTLLYIGNLVGLEMLSEFVVGMENGLSLKELENLKNLGGKLCISSLHNVREAEDAKHANIQMKEGLCELTMQWTEEFGRFRDEELEARVLNSLLNLTSLTSLTIEDIAELTCLNHGFTSSLINLEKLKIVRFESIKHFPTRRMLLQLQELRVWGSRNMKQPVREWLTPLTSLQELRVDSSARGVGEEKDLLLPLPSSLLHLYISKMGNVERLSSGLYPSLQTLRFYKCLKLREFPRMACLPP